MGKGALWTLTGMFLGSLLGCAVVSLAATPEITKVRAANSQDTVSTTEDDISTDSHLSTVADEDIRLTAGTSIGNPVSIKTEKINGTPVKISVSEFKSFYNKLFRTSISGLNPFKKGGATIKKINGEEVSYWNTDLFMPGASSAMIEYRKDDEELKYVASYHTGISKDNAQQALNGLLKLVEENIPETYTSHFSFSGEFVDFKEYIFEYQSDKFSDIMKRPIISLGIQKRDEEYKVIFSLTEPYYKNQY